MSDQLLKSVRITDAIKVEVYQQGRRRKYALFYDSANPKINNKRGNTDNTKSEKYDVSLTDDQVIEEALKSYNLRFSDGVNLYKVEQDPYQEVPKRIYGSTQTPYYLNNGCRITVEWMGRKPNEYFNLGTFSTAKESQQFKIDQWVLGGYAGGYIPRWRENENITSDYDVSSLYSMAPFSTWVVPTGEISESTLQEIPNYRDYTTVEEKWITVYLPDEVTENGGKYLIWNKNNELANWNEDRNNTYFSIIKDESIVSQVIQKFKSMVTKLHGISDYDLKLCPIDVEYCKLIDYKSPIKAPDNTPQQAAINDTPTGSSQSTTKIKLNIQGLFDSGTGTTGTTSSVFEIKAKTDMPTFTIWTGEIPKTEEIDVFDDLQELDEEYIEDKFNGDEEAPPDIKDPDPLVSNVNDNGSSQVNDTTVYETTTDGPIVPLPKGKTAYSHNATQGYNLIDSKWYGNLLTSAKQHIDTPTFDVPGTESGNLGCASWVSLVFYRAFGVHMKNGKSVKAIPKSISDFGSTGTGELGGWFGANPNMWTQIPWKEGQPGDVINTERGSKAGHVGVVMDTKNKDGSWNVASNSSGGFGNASDPLGCGKMNYSITKWQSVTNRNPNRTFCWRYKGPKLTQGQTA